MKPLGMLLLLGSCENIQNSICKSACQQAGFGIISNSVHSNRAQRSHSPAAGSD